MATNIVGQALLTSGEFFQKILDCLQSHIAILDAEGTIVAVNATWNEFASNNGLATEFCGPGANYLRSCDNASGDCSDEAKIMAEAIRDVIANRRGYFSLEYPCHSSLEKRWFSVRVTRFEINYSVQVVVTHDNITQRKRTELELNDANRLLVTAAATDEITGIANRRNFDTVLDREWRRHERTQSPITIAFVDVDCFKQFNDSNGHLSGDDCLKAIAQTLDSTVKRAGDFVARYRGEEFAIILPATKEAVAKKILGEVLRGVRELAIPHPTSTVRRGIVTVSIGTITVIPSENESVLETLRRADDALYEAKANGRDQLVCADQLMFASSCR